MRIGRIGGGREDVDDRAAPGDLAAVLDQLFAPVAEPDQRVEQRIGIDDVVRSRRGSARR